MQIDLSDDEISVLHDVLTVDLGDLSMEIAATDNPVFRRGLRDRQRHLLRIRSALAGHTEAD